MIARQAGAAQQIFDVRHLQPFGVEVAFDLSCFDVAEHGGDLADLLFREKLLVFRGQTLTADQQVSVMSAIGPVLDETRDHREVQADGNLGGGPLAFHSDLSFTPEPHVALSLHALDVEPGETYTAFANAIRAWDVLPARLRDRLDSLEVLDRLSIVQSHRLVLSDDEAGFLPSDVHPVVRTHDVTGEQLLYVNEAQTMRMVGLSDREGEALLQELFAALYDSSNVYRHYWMPGDIVIWDNLALQHARPDLRSVKRRRLQRVSVAEHSFGELCPQFDRHDPRISALAGAAAFRKI